METQARYETRGPITYNESIEAARKELSAAIAAGENLLMPTDSLGNVPAMHKVSVERIKLSPDPQDKDVYVQQGKDDDTPDKKRYALTKDGLLKLSSCAGVQWDYDHSGRIDKHETPDYISWRIVGAIQRLDGSWLPLQGAYDLDFDVIEEQILEQKKATAAKWWTNAKWYKELGKEGQQAYIQKKAREDLLLVKRHKVARCETGAMLRAIRGLLNIKGTYSYSELQKPFVIARLVFQPDYADPIIKAQAVALAFKAMQGVYGISAPSFPQARQIPQNLPIDLEENGHGGYGIPEMPEDLEPPPPSPADDPPPDKAEAQKIDFENATQADKIKTLETLCTRKGYAREKGKALDKYSDKGLLLFYEKLVAMPDAVVADDIPF